MQIFCYGLISLSALLGIAVAGLGALLGWQLCASYINSDQMWGVIISVFSLIYLVHPALSYWLYKHTHLILAMLFNVLMIGCSIALIVLLASAIEAVARP